MAEGEFTVKLVVVVHAYGHHDKQAPGIEQRVADLLYGQFGDTVDVIDDEGRTIAPKG